MGHGCQLGEEGRKVYRGGFALSGFYVLKGSADSEPCEVGVNNNDNDNDNRLYVG